MIGRLKGIIDSIESDHVIVDVGGVGYAVFLHGRALASCAEGDAMCFTIETHVREDHIHLYGFSDMAEREWFRALTSVERVGAKMALTLLSALTPQQIVHAVIAKDTTAFTRISGVGPKLGERIVIELKDKVLKLPTEGSLSLVTNKTGKGKKQSAAPAEDNFTGDAISALINLGYTRSDAARAALTASGKSDGKKGLDQLIKESLKELQ